MIIATHSGKFHADDVWAVTVLDIVFPGAEIIRTRDPEKIERADFAVDVGGIWAPAEGRFDHHQRGFDGARASGVIYASAGLVWKTHGAHCVSLLAQAHCGVTIADDTAQQIATAMDSDLVQYLDMSDTGAAKNAPGSYGLSAIISGFNPNWLDERMAGSPQAAEALRLAQFKRAMAFMKDIIVNGVRYRIGGMLAVTQVRQAARLENGKILLLENSALPWSTLVRNEMPDVLFVISHDLAEQRYLVHTVPAKPETFEARKDLPAAWAGLRDAELAAVCGVPDAVFCHNNLFIAAAMSFEGALEMARLALKENPLPVSS